MALSIGQQAPDFTLFSDKREKTTLSDYRGQKNVILHFFPHAFTSVCTAQLCAMRDDISRYNNENAQVFGISVDSPQVLAKFREDQGINFPLLSDFNKEASTAFDAIYEIFGNMELRGVSKRAAFIVDKQGVIQYSEVLDNPGNIPNIGAINDVLARLS